MTLSRNVAMLAIACGLLAGPATAENYPSRTVKVVVPFGAGGPTDVYARAIAAELQKSMHVTFVMENRPGAGTTIGTEAVATAAPDGYTLLMVSGTQTVNETLYGHKPYRLMQNLVPIAPLIETDLVLVVNPKVPAHNLKELLALARAKPGTLNYGSSGPGSNYHMAGELLKNITGINIQHIPYKGSGGMRTDILSGQIQILFDSVPTMAPLIKAGKVRALGTSGLTPSPILPGVPTLDQAGAKGFHATLWVGFMAPAGTPQPIVDLLNREITKAVNQPALKKTWEEQGATPLTMTQPAYKAFMQAQIDKWANIIATNHIKHIN
ncbi:MAG: tripartite tricarboxylate transporter substrate binding protein [Rhodopseudomonas sp.]|nr:tripartite tricarboxylate transporter substrate binding protein [Rhodopseudomonas sp.]